jgi:hypothetical protein
MTTPATRFLNPAVMESINPDEFQSTHPFPWTNPQGFILEDAYQELLANMPPIESFTPSFGKQRKSGQASHDRYILDYEKGIELPEPWRAFVDELLSDTYRSFVCRLLGVSKVRFRLHWHYTPRGAEVGPHCDARGKLGSQIFYLTTPESWDPAWGGETVILDDHGRFPTYSNPQFEEFDEQWPALTMDNRSILFGRRGNSWHGVKQINCPEGYYRQVLIVVFEEYRPFKILTKKIARLFGSKSKAARKEALTF